MKSLLVVSLTILSALAATSCRNTPQPDLSEVAGTQAQGHGTIKGHVRLSGTPPENAVIRMRADPMCDTANAGQRAVQETVVADATGSLANVFVQLQGSFPATAAPAEPVTIDQRGCVYIPRMVGVRVGQTVRVQNSDPGLHNVHGVSAGKDGFNIGQPMAGMVNELHLKDEGVLRLQCDVHTWMVAFVGVVSHPYFAVTGTAGTFEIHDVPVGTHTIQAWHELYGMLTSTVRVEAGGVAETEFTYSADKRAESRETIGNIGGVAGG
jgi:plastocyanin